MKTVLGLTGPTGSGKTTAGQKAKKLGWYVIDCDKVAREAVKDKTALCALKNAFGDDITDQNGELNRKILAQRAFSSEQNTELLNKTLLPFVVELVKKKIDDSNSDKILLDAPTLFESGADALCSKICAVLSSKENRLVRIMKRDNIDEQSALLRMSAGKSDEYYKSKTMHIIYNDTDTKTLEQQFAMFLKNNGR